jgi:hypothetical protein
LAILKKPALSVPEVLKFMRQRGMELIGFIHGVIKELRLPRRKSGDGGVSIIGWSLGNIYCFTIMGCFNDQHLPDPWRKTVKECISTVLLFG